ncbi:outer membrane homotrimeric porin [Solidesulfovibrio sp.]|uniref:outer membrane homotrimeric porin n=1 Tax=Solidesulfovibrio sp. TaxID=2910990 RepID=UPI002611C674|nr:outer membrane homotrimeric porin [Solidesulfovibrio sp.]
MKKALLVCLAGLLFWGAGSSARAATEVKFVGDARVYGVYFSGHNFTGWNDAAWTSNTPAWTKAGTKTEDTFEVWQRLRVRTDFVANEAVKFRLGIKIDNTWGTGTYTAANPDASGVLVYQAFLQFKWPGCDVEVTAGLQDVSLPQSAIFSGSLIFDDTAAALTVRAPLIPDLLTLNAGFARMIDTNRTYDTTTTQSDDEMDWYFLTLPVTTPGFKVTPWGIVGVAGKGSGYYTTYASSFAQASVAEDILSAGTLISPTKWKNNQNLYFWGGGAFEVSALDPVRFYADVMYGGGAFNDLKKSKRGGWFIDFGTEFTGWDLLTPQLFAWWGTGEDASVLNGSERMPHNRPAWGPGGGSFLFDGGQVLARNSNMGVDPVGTYGMAASLKNISLVEKLSHTLTFAYIHGNNSPKAVRFLNYYLGGGDLYAGSNPYFCMGRDLTSNEHEFALNLDSEYSLYENLKIRMETGWAKGQFQESVWGRRLVHKADDMGGTWKVALGFTYKY